MLVTPYEMPPPLGVQVDGVGAGVPMRLIDADPEDGDRRVVRGARHRAAHAQLSVRGQTGEIRGADRRRRDAVGGGPGVAFPGSRGDVAAGGHGEDVALPGGDTCRCLTQSTNAPLAAPMTLQLLLRMHLLKHCVSGSVSTQRVGARPVPQVVELGVGGGAAAAAGGPPPAPPWRPRSPSCRRRRSFPRCRSRSCPSIGSGRRSWRRTDSSPPRGRRSNRSRPPPCSRSDRRCRPFGRRGCTRAASCSRARRRRPRPGWDRRSSRTRGRRPCCRPSCSILRNPTAPLPAQRPQSRRPQSMTTNDPDPTPQV